jgi:hypothetical protein
MAEKKQRGGYRQINDALNICAFEDYLDAQHTHLPEIADVEQISPRVVRVLGQNAGKVSHSIVTFLPYFFELLQFCFRLFVVDLCTYTALSYPTVYVTGDKYLHRRHG